MTSNRFTTRNLNVSGYDRRSDLFCPMEVKQGISVMKFVSDLRQVGCFFPDTPVS
jgi:hypothetical protein